MTVGRLVSADAGAAADARSATDASTAADAGSTADTGSTGGVHEVLLGFCVPLTTRGDDEWRIAEEVWINHSLQRAGIPSAEISLADPKPLGHNHSGATCWLGLQHQYRLLFEPAPEWPSQYLTERDRPRGLFVHEQGLTLAYG